MRRISNRLTRFFTLKWYQVRDAVGPRVKLVLEFEDDQQLGEERSKSEHFADIIIGGGSGGINMALELKTHGIEYVLLEGQDNVGDQWG